MTTTCQCPGGYWSGPKVACSVCGEPTGRRCAGCEVYLCIDCGSHSHPQPAASFTEREG
jgi:hypothetical protein